MSSANPGLGKEGMMSDDDIRKTAMRASIAIRSVAPIVQTITEQQDTFLLAYTASKLDEMGYSIGGVITPTQRLAVLSQAEERLQHIIQNMNALEGEIPS